MSIIVSNFQDIHYLNSLRDISSSIIFSDRSNIDLSGIPNTSNFVYINNNGQLTKLEKTLWRDTNIKILELLPKYTSNISNNIYNIYFIDYLLNNGLSNEGLNLFSSIDSSGIFGIYSEKSVYVNESIYKLYFSNKLRTFVLYDINENNLDGLNYIVGQLMPYIKIDDKNKIILGNRKYECPNTWKHLTGNTYGIARVSVLQNNEKDIVQVSKTEYYPIHILSELKALYAWMSILWNTLLSENKYERYKFKKLKYEFNNREYENIIKYAGDQSIIDYIIRGYIKFIAIQWNRYKLVEVNINGKMENLYPLVPRINNYRFYEKSNWMNYYGMKLISMDYLKGLYDNISKIKINVIIEQKEYLKEDISLDVCRDFMEIDIVLNKDNTMSHILYVRNTKEMKKWKKLLDIFLNEWTF
jgi:hypothetical protein